MMLRLLIVLIFLGSGITGIWGQTPAKRVFTLLPALGINGCQVHGDSYSGYNKLGFFAGAAVNAELSKKSSLQLGFYFSQKGSRHRPNPKVGDYTSFWMRLNYLDLALSLRHFVNSKYFFTLGPSVGYLISYRVDHNYYEITDQYAFNRLELGLNIGLGRKINERLGAELRCSNSIRTIMPYGQASQIPTYNFVARYFNKGLYNNILTLFVTYTIGVKKESSEQ